MKKFLTLLLALSVVFTYSFSTVSAATTYTADDVAKALDTEIQNQLTYLNSAKSQAVNSYTYDDKGFATIGGAQYFKASIEAAGDKVISDAEKSMKEKAREVVDAVPAEGTDTINKTPVLDVTKSLLTMTEFKGALETKTDTLNEAQEPLLKSYYAAQITKNYDPSLYSEKGEYYLESKTVGPLNAKEAVAYAVDKAKKAINDASTDSSKTDTQKMEAYKNAYEAIATTIAGATDKDGNPLEIKTKDEEDQAESEAYKTVEAALAGMRAYALGDFYDDNKLTVPATDATVVLADFFKNNTAFYTAKTTKADATVFGVTVKDVTKVTRAEAIAINNAFYDAMVKSIDAAKAYAGTSVAKVVALFKKDDAAVYTKTLANAVSVNSKYAEVVTLGNQYKAEYNYGVKIYDDAKVDAAVKAAETFVYADLGEAALGTAESYIIAAANDIHNNNAGLNNLKIADSKYAELVAAIEVAKDKFIPAVINYGTDKTAEADKKYCKNYYATSAGAEYDKIKTATKAALDKAQNYEDITAAMAEADAKLAKLMTAADADAVAKAQDQYRAAFAQYAKEQYELIDKSKYTMDQFDKVVDAGEALIDDAITVEDVKAAYAEAQALVKALKTDDQLKEMAKAVDALVLALPYKANIKVTDKDQIDAARKAYDEFLKTPGAAANQLGVSTKTTLEAAENQVTALQRAELVEKLADLEKKLDNVGAGDAAVKAMLALKEEATALYDQIEAFNKYITDYNADPAHTDDLTTTVIDNTNLEALLTAAEGRMWDAEVTNAEIALVKAMKDDATSEEIKEAIKLYNALTDRQQYKIDTNPAGYIRIVSQKVIKATESLKIKTSTKLYKGKKIQVKWRIADGDASMIDGYQVYKSTKANSGYKFMGKTKKLSMDNKKGLVKGKRYFYKVRAYVDVDGDRYYSDWSNKGNRIYKK